jgi:hypothetical protein
MSHAKQTSRRKRVRKTVPALGAAGLALSLASGASGVIAAPAAEAPNAQSTVSHEITLAEEELRDVSLATFCVFDKEHPGAPRFGARLAMGACGGCAGCGSCGGCWTGTYYDGSVFGNQPNPPHHAVRPAHKSAHAPKHKHVVKNP